MSQAPPPSSSKSCLSAVRLDERSIGRGNPDQEHERAVAIYDLIEENLFSPDGHDGGPYALTISLQDGRLVFDIRSEAGDPVVAHILSLTPLRRVIRDYFAICESYFKAVRSPSPRGIEAIDMARRGLHNEAAETLIECLADKVSMDFDTARRLFTLICVLHIKQSTTAVDSHAHGAASRAG
jgi:uncharacterized protein (UPF0262 family)